MTAHLKSCQLSSALSFCPVLISPKYIWSANFKNFKILMPVWSVVLPDLTTDLRYFVIYTSFLSNPVFSTQFVLLPLNQSATRPLPISLISFNSIFLLAKSARLPILVFHWLISGFLVDMPSSINHHYCGIIPFPLRHCSLVSECLVCECVCASVHYCCCCCVGLGRFALEVM